MAPTLNMSSLPPGIAYIDDFLSAEEEGSVAGRLDAGEWSTVLKRRVQHFGYLYDYKARTITKDAYLGKLPGWLEVLAERLVARASLEDMPD